MKVKEEVTIDGEVWIITKDGDKTTKELKMTPAQQAILNAPKRTMVTVIEEILTKIAKIEQDIAILKAK
jgi:uncharacterized lipoprotein YajG